MFDWFFALEQSNKVVISLFALGAAWGGVKIYANSVKPKHSPPPEPTQIIRFTIDEYESRIQTKIATALNERDHATGKDLDIKNAQIAELKNDLANIEQSFEKQKQFIAKLETDLKREGNTLGADALEKATQALEAGDTSLAETLFQQIKDRTELDVQASARASFALGEIAEKEVRWQDAFEHYNEAARLYPCFDYLIHAQEMALQIANYSQADSLAEAAQDAAAEEYGKDSPRYSTALNNHARVFEITGRYEEAELLYRQALEVARVELGEDHSYYGISLNNLAGVLRILGRFDEAERLYRQALENARVALGEEDSQFGGTLSNLGGLLKNTGRLEEAEPLYRQALANTRLALGENHPRFGTSLNNLAGLLEKMGRDEEAEPLYRQALAVTRIALGEEHPDFGIRLNNLALLLKATGRFDEAEPLFKQAVDVCENAYGPDHPSTKTVKANFEHFLANRPTTD